MYSGTLSYRQYRTVPKQISSRSNNIHADFLRGLSHYTAQLTRPTWLMLLPDFVLGQLLEQHVLFLDFFSPEFYPPHKLHSHSPPSLIHCLRHHLRPWSSLRLSLEHLSTKVLSASFSLSSSTTQSHLLPLFIFIVLLFVFRRFSNALCREFSSFQQ